MLLSFDPFGEVVCGEIPERTVRVLGRVFVLPRLIRQVLGPKDEIPESVLAFMTACLHWMGEVG